MTVDAVILNDFRVARGRPGHHAYGYYRASPDYFRSERAERRSARRAASRTTDSPRGKPPEGSAVTPEPATKVGPTQPPLEGGPRSQDDAAEPQPTPQPAASNPNGAVTVTQTHPSTARSNST